MEIRHHLEYRPGLDGLRALSVLAVVLFHSGYGWASGGFLGVSVFFTLSGFLITSLLLAEQSTTGTVSWRRFYVRRARRLLPASLVCIGLVVACAPWWSNVQQRRLPGDVLASLAEVANWRAAWGEASYRDMFEQAASPLAHFWSLSIEEQCYLLLPMVVLACLRSGRRALVVVLIGLAAASTVAMMLTGGFDLAYNGTHTRAAELLVGASAAAVLAGRRPQSRTLQGAGVGVLGIVAALVATTTLDSAWVVNGGLTLFAVGTVVLVLAASTGPLGRVLGWRPLVAVGQVSYGVYLFHWPVFVLVSPERVGFAGVGLLALRLAVVSALVMASYHLVEQPIRRGRIMPKPRQALAVLCSATLVLAVLALVALPRPALSATEALLARADGSVVTFNSVSMRSSTTVALPPDPSSAVGAARPAAPIAPDVVVVGSAPVDLGSLGAAGIIVESEVDSRCPIVRGEDVLLDDGSVVSIAGCGDPATTWTSPIGAGAGTVAVVTLGGLDDGLVRRAEDVGFPAADDLSEVARRLVWVESEISRVLDALAARSRSVVVVDRSGSERMAELLARVARARPGLRIVDEAAAPQAVVAAVGMLDGLAVPSERPVRVVVLGDSTSFLVAEALHVAAAGTLDVQWAGQQGCPLASIEATRSSPTADWVEVECEPWADRVRSLLTSFDPDAALFVAGGSQLLEHRYPGDPAGHVAGSEGYSARHEADLAALLAVLGPHGVPLLVADAPPLEVGGFVTRSMTDPDRLGAWNDLIHDWDELHEDVMVWAYADAIVGYEAVHGSIRPDGSHPEIEPLTTIAREVLVDRLRSAVRGPGLGG